VAIKDPEHPRIVERWVTRVDTLNKVTGAAAFLIDMTLPGIVDAKIEDYPLIDGNKRSFDASPPRATGKRKRRQELLPVPLIRTNQQSRNK
jgi:hypothetical protein